MLNDEDDSIVGYLEAPLGGHISLAKAAYIVGKNAVKTYKYLNSLDDQVVSDLEDLPWEDVADDIGPFL